MKWRGNLFHGMDMNTIASDPVVACWWPQMNGLNIGEWIHWASAYSHLIFFQWTANRNQSRGSGVAHSETHWSSDWRMSSSQIMIWFGPYLKKMYGSLYWKESNSLCLQVHTLCSWRRRLRGSVCLDFHRRFQNMRIFAAIGSPPFHSIFSAIELPPFKQPRDWKRFRELKTSTIRNKMIGRSTLCFAIMAMACFISASSSACKDRKDAPGFHKVPTYVCTCVTSSGKKCTVETIDKKSCSC